MSRVHPLDFIPKYLCTQVFPERTSPLSIGVRDGTLGSYSFVITPNVPSYTTKDATVLCTTCFL